MKRIWAPWRMEYIQIKKGAGCFFCEKSSQNDDDANYILFRGDQNFVIMNIYPYNPGHLLVVTYRHIATLEEMAEDERHEHFDIVSRGIQVLRQVFNPDGFNLGINLGKIAGAGIADHIHSHIVPRWLGDTNAMPVISDVKVVPEALSETYQRLRGKF